MSVYFNHTIIAAKDRAVSAAFYRDLLEVADAPSWGFFTNLQLDGGVLLQFAVHLRPGELWRGVSESTLTLTPVARLSVPVSGACGGLDVDR